jgi:hypothetical protein
VQCVGINDTARQTGTGNGNQADGHTDTQTDHQVVKPLVALTTTWNVFYDKYTEKDKTTTK